MAEDVLRLAGFVEGVNYIRQKVLEMAASHRSTPGCRRASRSTWTSSCPLNSYLRFLETDNEAAREGHKTQFLRDVRTRIREVTTRDYTSTRRRRLPGLRSESWSNEQVYAFINENDPGLMDEALKNKVILCSPFTLFAILAIIRQSLDNFSMEKTAGEILGLVKNFKKEWEKFAEAMAKMGEKLDGAREEYRKMTTTRHDKLDKSIQKIEDMQRFERDRRSGRAGRYRGPGPRGRRRQSARRVNR